MASKLEYLQRYISGDGGDAANGDKKKKKKVKKTKKTKSAALGTRVVDADDAWEQSAPNREAIEKKWEMDAAEDEQPLVVAADGEELVDPQDLPVYVDSDKYMDEFKGRTKQPKKDEDLSPPRKKTAGRSKSEDEVSLKRDDSSPPRRRSNAEKKASRRRRGESDEETSPPRRQRREKSTASEERGGDASPPRRSKRRERDEEDDTSPPRRKSNDERKERSPRRAREEDSDASPPRHRVRKEAAFPAERKSTTVKEEDASPPRRSRRDGSDLKYDKRRSPAALDRQRRVDSLGRDIPSRSGGSERQSRSAFEEDKTSSKSRDRKSARSRSRSRDRGRSRDVSASPQRSRTRQSRSRSPRSRRRDSRSPSVHRRRSLRKSSRWSSPQRRESPRRRGREKRPSPDKFKTETAKQSSGEKEVKREPKKAGDEKDEKKAGLFTAAEFEHQRKIGAKRKDVLRGVDASEMGANAETVYRDKRGRKLDMLNEMVRQQEILDGKRKREEREEYEWGTGEVQKRERKSQQELLEQMKKTPFARHEDDEDLERKRRERVRAFDPMNSKVFQEDPLAEGKAKKKKRSKKDKKTNKARSKYAGPPAPTNRFGIQPGYRWDGVVRGTNWEEKIMMRQNANAAVSEEAYKYAVADM
ncbi:hypothetical protein PI125_g4462 [Phytophthora idaei]|nr:hypothetical protein PI125_g4462 [Phytophthora idaei]